MQIEFMGIPLSLEDAKDLAIGQFEAEVEYMKDGGIDQFSREELRRWKSQVKSGNPESIGIYLNAMVSYPQYDDYRDDVSVEKILRNYSTTLGDLVQKNAASPNHD